MNERKKMIVSPQGMSSTLAEIDQIRAEVAASAAESDMTRAIVMARGMNMLRQRIKGDVLKEICQLAGSPLGFLTDRDQDDKKGPYPEHVIRDAAVEALISGARLIGNEFNVIAGKCYLTKAYFARQLASLVDELEIIEGVPETHKHGALVPVIAKWKQGGRSQRIECVKDGETDHRIPVRVNAGMGVDAILGKAHRKIYARIYRQVTGSDWGDTETDEPLGQVSGEVAADAVEEAESQDSDPDSNYQGALVALAQCQTLREIDDIERRWRWLLTAAEQVAWQEECENSREKIRSRSGSTCAPNMEYVDGE